MTHSLLLPDRIRSLLQAWSKPDWRFQCYSWMVSFAIAVKYAKMKPSQTHLHLTAAARQSCCLQMTYSQLRATVPPSVRTKALISAQSWTQTTTSEIQASLILPGNYPEKLCGTSNLSTAPSSPGSATSNSTAQPCPLHHPPFPKFKPLGKLLKLLAQTPMFSKAARVALKKKKSEFRMLNWLIFGSFAQVFSF